MTNPPSAQNNGVNVAPENEPLEQEKSLLYQQKATQSYDAMKRNEILENKEKPPGTLDKIFSWWDKRSNADKALIVVGAVAVTAIIWKAIDSFKDSTDQEKSLMERIFGGTWMKLLGAGAIGTLGWKGVKMVMDRFRVGDLGGAKLMIAQRILSHPDGKEAGVEEYLGMRSTFPIPGLPDENDSVLAWAQGIVEEQGEDSEEESGDQEQNPEGIGIDEDYITPKQLEVVLAGHATEVAGDITRFGMQYPGYATLIVATPGVATTFTKIGEGSFGALRAIIPNNVVVGGGVFGAILLAHDHFKDKRIPKSEPAFIKEVQESNLPDPTKEEIIKNAPKVLAFLKGEYPMRDVLADVGFGIGTIVGWAFEIVDENVHPAQKLMISQANQNGLRQLKGTLIDLTRTLPNGDHRKIGSPHLASINTVIEKIRVRIKQDPEGYELTDSDLLEIESVIQAYMSEYDPPKYFKTRILKTGLIGYKFAETSIDDTFEPDAYLGIEGGLPLDEAARKAKNFNPNPTDTLAEAAFVGGNVMLQEFGRETWDLYIGDIGRLINDVIENPEKEGEKRSIIFDTGKGLAYYVGDKVGTLVLGPIDLVTDHFTSDREIQFTEYAQTVGQTMGVYFAIGWLPSVFRHGLFRGTITRLGKTALLPAEALGNLIRFKGKFLSHKHFFDMLGNTIKSAGSSVAADLRRMHGAASKLYSIRASLVGTASQRMVGSNMFKDASGLARILSEALDGKYTQSQILDMFTDLRNADPKKIDAFLDTVLNPAIQNQYQKNPGILRSLGRFARNIIFPGEATRTATNLPKPNIPRPSMSNVPRPNSAAPTPDAPRSTPKVGETVPSRQRLAQMLAEKKNIAMGKAQQVADDFLKRLPTATRVGVLDGLPIMALLFSYYDLHHSGDDPEEIVKRNAQMMVSYLAFQRGYRIGGPGMSIGGQGRKLAQGALAGLLVFFGVEWTEDQMTDWLEEKIFQAGQFDTAVYNEMKDLMMVVDTALVYGALRLTGRKLLGKALIGRIRRTMISRIARRVSIGAGKQIAKMTAGRLAVGAAAGSTGIGLVVTVGMIIWGAVEAGQIAAMISRARKVNNLFKERDDKEIKDLNFGSEEEEGRFRSEVRRKVLADMDPATRTLLEESEVENLVDQKMQDMEEEEMMTYIGYMGEVEIEITRVGMPGYERYLMHGDQVKRVEINDGEDTVQLTAEELDGAQQNWIPPKDYEMQDIPYNELTVGEQAFLEGLDAGEKENYMANRLQILYQTEFDRMVRATKWSNAQLEYVDDNTLKMTRRDFPKWPIELKRDPKYNTWTIEGISQNFKNLQAAMAFANLNRYMYQIICDNSHGFGNDNDPFDIEDGTTLYYDKPYWGRYVNMLSSEPKEYTEEQMESFNKDRKAKWPQYEAALRELGATDEQIEIERQEFFTPPASWIGFYQDSLGISLQEMKSWMNQYYAHQRPPISDYYWWKHPKERNQSSYDEGDFDLAFSGCP